MEKEREKSSSFKHLQSFHFTFTAQQRRVR